VKSIKKSELFAALGFMLVSVLAIQQGLKTDFITRGIPGPGFLPVIIGIAMLLLSISLIITAVRKAQRNKAPDSTAKKLINLKMAATVLGLALYIFLTKPLGYIFSTFIFCVIQFHFWGDYKWYKTLLLSLVFTLAMYFIFVHWIGIPLKAGLGF
jgi:putative tricarboxylic transport membrane protein